MSILPDELSGVKPDHGVPPGPGPASATPGTTNPDPAESVLDLPLVTVDPRLLQLMEAAFRRGEEWWRGHRLDWVPGPAFARTGLSTEPAGRVLRAAPYPWNHIAGTFPEQWRRATQGRGPEPRDLELLQRVLVLTRANRALFGDLIMELIADRLLDAIGIAMEGTSNG